MNLMASFGEMMLFYWPALLLNLAFGLPALYYLRGRQLDETSRAVWALAIVIVPLMGAVAFALVRPGRLR